MRENNANQNNKIKNKLKKIELEKRMKYYLEFYTSKLECFFGLGGVIICAICIIIAAFLTPGYSPFTNTISSLGSGIAKTIFSIAFVTVGSMNIPFYIYLEKTFRGIHRLIRRLATGISIFTCLCIAYVGILPDPEYPNVFLWFHGSITFVAFFGSVSYICLYSYLMLKSNQYKLYYIVIGFATALNLILLALSNFNPFIEWILSINIWLWIFITSIHLILR